MTERMRKSIAAALCLALLHLFASDAAVSGELGTLPLRPGESRPAPRQRGLDEIHELPTREETCPVCGHKVTVPLADKLMRRPAGFAGELTWEMHAERRDSDYCPYPGEGKLSYQADVVVCPSCGYAREEGAFSAPVPREAAAWIMTSLRPALREAETALIGTRRGEMTEDEMIAWFGDQERIPDTIRTEHWRTYLLAIHAPPRERARACLLAAWASRRETAARPRGAVLARHAAKVSADLAKAKRSEPGLHGDITALREMLRRMQAKNRDSLPGADHMAGRMLLAGLWVRLGFLAEAEETLQALYHECRERFLRPEQDPLWGSTSARAARTDRLDQLEAARVDAENEVLMRLEMVRREREQLTAAAQCLRDAFRAGDFDASPDEARFQAYMVGEILRRAGNLPLAAEWFKNLLGVAPADSEIARAAAVQLECVGEEAGDRVNLLSALGQDGELFARLRKICTGR